MVFKWKGFIQNREIKSRRDDTLLTVGFNLRRSQHDTLTQQSRRDDTLLTVDFNLRNVKTQCIASLQNPSGIAQWEDKLSSLRDFISLFWINPFHLKTMICFLFFIPYLAGYT